VGLFLQGHLRPVVDRVVAPNQIQEAYACMEAGTQFGKLVVDWRS
jgi:NADPH:quinone reductase-like Zn-dependent oxidoreductase